MDRSFSARALLRVVVLTLPLPLVAGVLSPAHAVPTPSGNYVSVAATPDRAVVPDECRNVADRVYTLDLQGLGAEVEAQGYHTYSGDPVYTELEWSRSSRITGPGNFYATGTDYITFPTSTFEASLEVCPEDFDGGEVLPGTYTFETTLTADTGYTRLCSDAEGCQSYDLYKRVLTYQVQVAAEVNTACITAKAKLKTTKAKFKKAKKKALRAPTKANRQAAMKLKHKVVRAKDKVRTAC